MNNLIASMSLIARENDPKEYPVEISIGMPYVFTEEEWGCPVSITPWKWQLVAAR
jgi:hypothetical protein